MYTYLFRFNKLANKTYTFSRMNKQIKTALISVFHKEGIKPIVKKLSELGVTIFSTGGTQKFIEMLGAKVIPVESLTSYPSILGGRVKTLHPKIFGGILSRRELRSDISQLEEHNIPQIDLVIVDLYPFQETIAKTKNEEEIIEKIDIGGVSLIRAGAKNYNDVVIIPSRNEYAYLLNILEKQKGISSLNDRKFLAAKAFEITSEYDTAIHSYFSRKLNTTMPNMNGVAAKKKMLRYGENPHQKGNFYGDFEKMFLQLNGKELSYNNFLDIDAAVDLIAEFSETTFGILKHNNPCGVASRSNLIEAWKDALSGDPVSAFGGIFITNTKIDEETANEITKLFFEIIIAPDYDKKALNILKQKPNRIILQQKEFDPPKMLIRSVLNGYLEQDRDFKTENENDMKPVTKVVPTKKQYSDLVFANKIAKHTKSNAIVLVRNTQLLGSGVGQTSRVDALKQAITKAKSFGFDLKEAVMASDAFFPFPDCVEIAYNAGIKAIVQPGGSIKDKESIAFCNQHKIAMVMTGIRHFRH